MPITKKQLKLKNYYFNFFFNLVVWKNNILLFFFEKRRYIWLKNLKFKISLKYK